MEANLKSESVKVFATILKCLNKIGSEVILHAYPQYLQLSSLNKTKSTFVKVKCYSNFFQSYSITSASNSELTCRVATGPLYEVFKQKARSSSSSSSTASPLLIQSSKLAFTPQSSLLSIHHVSPDQVDTAYTLHMLVPQSPVLIPMEILPSASTSSFTVAPSIVTQWLSHFLPKQEEITMICSRHGVTLKSFSDFDADPALRTVLQMPSSVFEAYCFLSDSLSNETQLAEIDISNIELTFNLKDLKGLLSFAESMNLPMSASFEAPGRPVLFSVLFPSSSPTSLSTTGDKPFLAPSSSTLMALEFMIATVQPVTSTHALYPFSGTAASSSSSSSSSSLFTSVLHNSTPVSHVSASHVSATPGGSAGTPVRATAHSVVPFPFGPDSEEVVPGTPPEPAASWEAFF